METKQILKEIELKKDEAVILLSKLIEQKTVNPPGDEYKAAKVVEEFFKKYKIKYEKYEKEKGRTNIIGFVGNEKGKKLLTACHMDVVPEGDGWKTNPFKATIKDGKIYGRGATDNKGPLVSTLIAAAVLKGHEKELNGQYLIGAVVDEEKGSFFGMRYLMKEKKINPDYGLILDCSNEKNGIIVAEKGILVLKIVSYGKQAHASRPDFGINAIDKMSDFIHLIRNYKFKYKKHRFYRAPTMNVGNISGGSSSNIIPGRCEINVDIRYSKGQDVNRIVSDFKSLAKKIKKGKFEISIIENIRPSEVDVNNKLVKVLEKNMTLINKGKPKLKGIGGGTDSKSMIANKIIAVDITTTKCESHVANEYITTEELLNLSKIVALSFLDLLK